MSCVYGAAVCLELAVVKCEGWALMRSAGFDNLSAKEPRMEHPSPLQLT